MPGPGPYASWPSEVHARWIRAGNTFGRHLMAAARDYAFGRIPKDTPPAQRELAEKAALDAIYGVMMLLDGVARSPIDDEHRAEYVLSLRVLRESEEAPVERFELAPDGDGLCMGFHGWVAGNFGK
jgi:hypothetical protein